MNNLELAHQVRRETGGVFTINQSKKAINYVVRSILQGLQQDGKVMVGKMGTLNVVDKPERWGTHPQTGKKIKFKAQKHVKFKQSKALKGAINSK